MRSRPKSAACALNGGELTLQYWTATPGQGEWMAAEVRLVDLAVIKRYSLAVRQERAPAEAGGLRRFLERIEGRHAPVKVQLTGPVTLGLALTRAGVPGRAAFAVAADAVQVRARALLDHVARHAPGAPVVVFVDEPSLAVINHPGFPLAPYAVVDMLTAALASLDGAAATGIHCCGPAEWRIVFEARPDILSLPVALAD